MSNSSSASVSWDVNNIQMVTTVYLTILATLGTIGNILVVLTIMRVPQLHQISYFLVGNMAIVGLLTCLVAIPLHVAHMLVSPTSWEGRDPTLCKAQAHINFGLIMSTLANSAAISACRYRAVTALYNVRIQMMSKIAIFKLIFLIWAVPVLVAFSASPFLGFNPLVSDCLFLDLSQAFWYMNVALVIPALVSTFAMLALYVLIIKRVRNSHRKIFDNFCHSSISRTDNSVQTDTKERAVSGSESAKNDGSSLSQNQAEASPSNTAGITVFTTTTSNEAFNTPTTSYAPDTQTLSTSKLDEPRTLSSVSCSAQATSNQQSVTYLQPPKVGHPSKQVSIGLTHAEDSHTPSTQSHNNSGVSGRSDGKMTKTFQENERRKRWLRKEVSLVLHLFLAYFFFCLLYLPMCLAHVVHAFHSLGKESWLILYTLTLSFASNTWLVYGLLNVKCRRAIRSFLRGRRSF